MIKLYQFPAVWNLPNASPFCMKLETYLRMANLPYEVINVKDPRKAPKGKLPCISIDGEKIADSSFIIAHLQKTYNITLDNHLNATQKAQALTMRRLIEEHLYWAIVYSRWIDEKNWPTTNKVFFANLPAPMKYLVPFIVRKITQRALYEQGMGRHTQEQIYQLAVDDLQALNVLLGQQQFFFGDEPSSIDASAYAFLANILQSPIASPLQNYVKSQTSLVNYCARMKEKYFIPRA